MPAPSYSTCLLPTPQACFLFHISAPSSTCLISFPHACALQVVEGRSPAVRAAADEFTRFLFTTPAQREFAKLGFRVNPKVSKQAAESQVGVGIRTVEL